MQPFQTARIVIAAHGNTTVGNLFKNVANTATVTWGTPTNTRISNEVDITIFPSGFLQVGKSDGFDSVYQGQSISYTISISNVGSLAIPANTLRVTDTFLSNVSFTGINANGLTMDQVFSSGIVRAWNIKNKSLNPGEKISFLIGARVSSAPSTSTTINKASAAAKDSSDRALPLVDGFDINDITASPVTTLRFTKSVTPAQAQVGETFTFQDHRPEPRHSHAQQRQDERRFPRPAQPHQRHHQPWHCPAEHLHPRGADHHPNLEWRRGSNDRDPGQCEHLGRHPQDLAQPGVN